MSRLRFRIEICFYLDLHGLVFETSIYYWQDQPVYRRIHVSLAAIASKNGFNSGGFSTATDSGTATLRSSGSIASGERRNGIGIG